MKAKVLRRHTALITKQDKEVGLYQAYEFVGLLEAVKTRAFELFAGTDIGEIDHRELAALVRRESQKIRRSAHHSGLSQLLYGFFCFLLGFLIMNHQGRKKGRQKKEIGNHLRLQVLAQRHLTQGMLVVNELARGVIYNYGLERLNDPLKNQWASAYQGAMTVARVAFQLKTLELKTLLPNPVEDMFQGIDLLVPIEGNRRGLCLQITSSNQQTQSQCFRLNGKSAQTYPKEDQKRIGHILLGTLGFNSHHKTRWIPVYFSVATADIQPVILEWCPELFLSLWVMLRQIQPDLPSFHQRV
ncbi:MAG: hypothetical protein V1685_03930 [Parcubacteria group bacterium]